MLNEYAFTKLNTFLSIGLSAVMWHARFIEIQSYQLRISKAKVAMTLVGAH